MIKKLFVKLFTLTLTSLAFITITTVLSLSLLTKKFPPDFKAARHYVDDFSKIKENYQSMLVRSQNAIQQQGILDPNDTVFNKNEAAADQALATSENLALRQEVDQLKVRILQLETQNRQIINILNQR